MKLKIYVASSWRNPYQPDICKLLHANGHEVYDFRNPIDGDYGFHWRKMDADWQSWTPETYRAMLQHPMCEHGYGLDMQAMLWADTFVGVQPFGRSASMEMGWAAGAGKRTVLLLSEGEPELMVKMFDALVCDRAELNRVLLQFWRESACG